MPSPRSLIKDTERLALLEGAGFGLGGMITIIPDAGLLTILTLRLIQRLCLLYGFEERGQSERLELWMAAAAATGVDYGKDLAEKQILERLAPRIAERLALKLGQETAEKWVGRLIPLASSVIGGALNLCVCAGLGRTRAAQPAPAACFWPANCRASFSVAVGVYSSAGRTRLNFAAVLAETERLLPCKATPTFRRLSVVKTKTVRAILTRILSVRICLPF